MRKILAVTVLSAALAVSCLYAGDSINPEQKILLRDKSVIIGRILEMKNGQYTIKTDAMGEFKIGADKILEISAIDHQKKVKKAPVYSEDDYVEEKRPAIAIRDGSKPRPSQSSAASDDIKRQQDEVNSRVRSMTMNGEFLDSMMDLSQNSVMLDVMSDPDIMDAISSGDYDFLMNSEKMKNLMDSPEIKNMLGDMQP